MYLNLLPWYKELHMVHFERDRLLYLNTILKNCIVVLYIICTILHNYRDWDARMHAGMQPNSPGRNGTSTIRNFQCRPW